MLADGRGVFTRVVEFNSLLFIETSNSNEVFHSKTLQVYTVYLRNERISPSLDVQRKLFCLLDKCL